LIGMGMDGKKEKKPFVLRMDSEIMKSLEQWAGDDFRSVNGQIEFLLYEALRQAGRLRKASQAKNKDRHK